MNLSIPQNERIGDRNNQKTNMNKKTISTILLTLVAATGQAQIAENSLADTYWRNETTGDWFIGITQNHVIYANQVWDIANQVEKKDTYLLTLDNGTTIKVGKPKKGLRSMTIGHQKPVLCSPITTATLPDYPTKDMRTGFVDNGYREGDSVTIVGWLKDMPQEEWQKGSEFGLTWNSLITDEPEEFYTKMDSLGRFTLRFPVINTSEIWLDESRPNFISVAEPGETYFFLYDFKTGQKLWMGDNVRLQNELLAHPTEGRHDRIDFSQGGKVDAMDFKAQTDRTRAHWTAELQRRIAEHPTLSQRYIDYAEGALQNIQGESMMQAMYFMHDNKLPQEYMDIVSKEFWQKATKPYTLYDDFAYFMGTYLEYHTPQQGNLEIIQAMMDSLGCEYPLRDVYFTRMLCEMIEGMRTPFDSLSLALIERDYVKMPHARAELEKINDKYTALQQRLQQRDISNSPSLKSSDDLKDISEGEELLQKILEPFRGKFVLIDFWGTWCGPCKEALSHSEEEYERLKDYDIEYLYLANKSPKDLYEKVIKEYNVIGDNVAHYNLPDHQQSAIERHMNVHSFPTYKLFDRNGDLIDVKVEPRNLDALAELLEQLK